MTVIHKKAWRSAFEKVLSGEKTFEIRLADWECSPGDVLVLDEVDDVTKQYTGRSVQKTVGYVAKLAELPGYWSGEEVAEHGLQVISLIDTSTTACIRDAPLPDTNNANGNKS